MSVRNNMQTRSEATGFASARSFLWRYLAAAFTYPDAETWAWLTNEKTLSLVGATFLSRPGSGNRGRNAAPTEAYLQIFGHTVRGDCPPHEIEYGELKADRLYQPHRLADIAAFYRAFGLELAGDAPERVDHIAMECEFYAVLCAKEAYALEYSPDNLDVTRDAQKKFLREHLARWTPAFSRRLQRIANDAFYRSIAELLRVAVLAECERFGIQAGNEDIQLRPAEELVDPCGACGLAGTAFPGGGQRGE